MGRKNQMLHVGHFKYPVVVNMSIAEEVRSHSSISEKSIRVVVVVFMLDKCTNLLFYKQHLPLLPYRSLAQTTAVRRKRSNDQGCQIKKDKNRQLTFLRKKNSRKE